MDLKLAFSLPIVAVVSIAACGSGEQATPPTPSADAAEIEFPITSDTQLAAVALGSEGVYLANLGAGNEFSLGGHSFTGHEGRIQLIQPGTAEPTDLVSGLGAPISLAIGADKTIYFIDGFEDAVLSAAEGAEPTPMPFESDEPERIAVGPEGEVVLLTDDGVQILRTGDPNITTIPGGPSDEHAFAVAPDGAIVYVTDMDYTVIIEKGSTELEELRPPTPEGTKVLAIAFDPDGDRYELEETCGPDQPPAQIRPCVTTVHSLYKYDGRSAIDPKTVAVDGLKSPTSLAVDAAGVYVADGNSVLRFDPA